MNGNMQKVKIDELGEFMEILWRLLFANKMGAKSDYDGGAIGGLQRGSESAKSSTRRVWIGNIQYHLEGNVTYLGTVVVSASEGSQHHCVLHSVQLCGCRSSRELDLTRLCLANHSSIPHSTLATLTEISAFSFITNRNIVQRSWLFWLSFQYFHQWCL